MPRASPAWNAFNAGEFSEFLYGRTDLEKYGSGCTTLENFIPRVQGPASKRGGFQFEHECKRSRVNYVRAASWGSDVRNDGTKFTLTGSDHFGKNSGGTERVANKFNVSSVIGTVLAVVLQVNVETVSSVAAGAKVGPYGTAGTDDPEADSGATMYSRCNNTGQYANDTTVFQTTGIRTVDLGIQGILDLTAARAGAGLFSVSIRYSDEAAAATTGSNISEYNEGANAPMLIVTTLETSTLPVRLIPFEFSTTQAYVLEFGFGYFRVHRNSTVVAQTALAITGTTNATPVVVTTGVHSYFDGDEIFIFGTGIAALDGRYWFVRVLSATTFALLTSTAPGSTSATGSSARILDVFTPYFVASDDVNRLSFAQSADVLYLAHPNYAPRKISRTADAVWSITTIDFNHFPFAPENINESITINSSASTGSVTLTASSALFTSDMIGSYVKLRDIFESHNPPWVEHSDYSTSHDYDAFITGGAAGLGVGDRVHNEGKVYTAASVGGGGDKTGKVPPTHEIGTESDGSYTWEFTNYGYGYALITAFTDSTHVTATVIKTLPHKVATADFTTSLWSFGGWSAARGYPRAVVFFEDRLIWAGTASDPDTLFCSRTGRYEDHRATDEDDSAMVLTLNSSQVNTIEWMAVSSVLHIGTAGGEWFSKEADTPLTPSNVSSRIKQRSVYGSRAAVQPAVVENVVLFVQRSGKKIRELTPPSSLDTTAEEAPDLTLLADHIGARKFKQLAFQSEPNRILWAVMEDGTLTGFTYEKTQQVTGWHRHPLGGVNALVESIAVVPHPSGDRDRLWAVVKRTIGGQTVRYMEFQTTWFPGTAIANVFFLDSYGTATAGSPTTTITGLVWLEGQTVGVLADGLYVGTKVVTNATITLATAATTVTVGFLYNASLETLRVEAGSGDGTSQGDIKRIHNAVLRLYQTGKGLFVAPSLDDLDKGVRTVEVMRMEDFVANQANDIAEGSLYSGDTRPIAFPSSYEQKGRVALRHTTPLPCTVSAIFPTLTNMDR